MSKSHNFIEKLVEAQIWEPRIAHKIEKMYLKTYMTRLISYDNLADIQRQKDGYDFTIKSEEAKWEIKTRTFHKISYNVDILLETTSVVEKNILGWLYTSKADIIAYVWLNESKSNLMPYGYFIMLKELRKTTWYDNLPGDYELKHTHTNNYQYKTEFVCPKITHFPDGTLFPFNAKFDVDFSPPTILKQTKLGGSK